MENDFGHSENDDPNRTMVPFTEAERQQKRDADLLYRHGDYMGAIRIVSNMIRLNPQLQNDPGCIGVIMHAYHRLEDWRNTAVYAHRKLALTDEKDPIALSIAAAAFFHLKEYARAFYYMVRSLENKNNTGNHLASDLIVVILSAKQLGLWAEVILYAKQYREIKPNDRDILEIGLDAAKRLQIASDILFFAEHLLSIEESRNLLMIVMRAACGCRDFEKTLKYAERLIELDEELTNSDEALRYAKWAAFYLGDDRKLQRYILYLATAGDFRLDPAMPDWHSTADTHQRPALHKDELF